MNTLAALLESEFLWGIIIGAMTSVLGAVVSIRYQFYQQGRDLSAFTLRFLDDQIGTFVTMIASLDTNRTEDGLLDYHILGNLLAEIGLVEQNVEYFSRIQDEDLSRSLRAALMELRVRARQIMIVAALRTDPSGSGGGIVPATDLATIKRYSPEQLDGFLAQGLTELQALAARLVALQTRMRAARGLQALAAA